MKQNVWEVVNQAVKQIQTIAGEKWDLKTVEYQMGQDGYHLNIVFMEPKKVVYYPCKYCNEFSHTTGLHHHKNENGDIPIR